MLAATLLAFVPQGAPAAPAPESAPATIRTEALAPVPFEKVQLRDSFFAPRIETNRRATVDRVIGGPRPGISGTLP